MKSIVILGPTTSGKTKLGVQVAHRINGEIISADSRQVYRSMDIGTGKDLEEYTLGREKIPYHLIDIKEAGERYNLSDFQRDFQKSYQDIILRGKVPVIVGGTGLYIEAVLKNYHYSHIPVNDDLRKQIIDVPHDELCEILKSKNIQKIDFDTSTKKRTIRAIEISEFLKANQVTPNQFDQVDAHIFGIKAPRSEILERIKNRLKYRLENGLIEEVKDLLSRGIKAEDLIYYGLEYKYVTLHLSGEMTYSELYEKLNIAIRQYAKRQMTWFRRMERHGFKISWINGMDTVSTQCSSLIGQIQQSFS